MTQYGPSERKALEKAELTNRRQSYINAYITHFCATWDANHYDMNLGVVITPCDVETAHRLAHQSWEDVGCTLPICGKSSA